MNPQYLPIGPKFYYPPTNAYKELINEDKKYRIYF